MNPIRPIYSTNISLPISTTFSPTNARPNLHRCPHSVHKLQTRHATLIKRPHRPYTFTQLVTLSDGSTFTHRTTSPTPVYVSLKDTRNTQLWNPSSQKLLSVEADEAGKLKRFREKFGRGWDATGQSAGRQKDEGKGTVDGDTAGGDDAQRAAERLPQKEDEDNLMDLIGGYAKEAEERVKREAILSKKPNVTSGKTEGGKK